MRKTLLAAVALLALPTTAMAGFNAVPSKASLQNSAATNHVMPTGAKRAFKRMRGSGARGAREKSDRQKCLDKLLPQDGVDCLKKLKAKNK